VRTGNIAAPSLPASHRLCAPYIACCCCYLNVTLSLLALSTSGKRHVAVSTRSSVALSGMYLSGQEEGKFLCMLSHLIVHSLVPRAFCCEQHLDCCGITLALTREDRARGMPLRTQLKNAIANRRSEDVFREMALSKAALLIMSTLRKRRRSECCLSCHFIAHCKHSILRRRTSCCMF